MWLDETHSPFSMEPHSARSAPIALAPNRRVGPRGGAMGRPVQIQQDLHRTGWQRAPAVCPTEQRGLEPSPRVDAKCWQHWEPWVIRAPDGRRRLVVRDVPLELDDSGTLQRLALGVAHPVVGRAACTGGCEHGPHAVAAIGGGQNPARP